MANHDLLIAALEHADDERRARFEAQVADATSIAELVALLARIYRDDRDRRRLTEAAPARRGAASMSCVER